MKAMVCELCGSNDFVKQDGMYACQSCGTKFTVEEARKLFIDKSADLSNLLVRAQRFFDDGTIDKAIQYCERVLDIDANYPEAIALLRKVNLKLEENQLQGEIATLATYLATYIDDPRLVITQSMLMQICNMKSKVKGSESFEKQFFGMWNTIIAACPQKLQYNTNGNFINTLQGTILFMDANDLIDEMKLLNENYTKEYIALISSGEMLFDTSECRLIGYYDHFLRESFEIVSRNPVLLEVYKKGLAYAERLQKYPHIWILDYLHDNYTGSLPRQPNRFTFMFGKTIEHSCGDHNDEFASIRSLMTIDDSTIAQIEDHCEKKLAQLNEIIARAEKMRAKNRCVLCEGKLDQYNNWCVKCGMSTIYTGNEGITLYHHRRDRKLCGCCGAKLSKCSCKRDSIH